MIAPGLVGTFHSALHGRVFVRSPLPFKTGRAHHWMEAQRKGQAHSARNARNPPRDATEESATDNTHSPWPMPVYFLFLHCQNKYSTPWPLLLKRAETESPSHATDVEAKHCARVCCTLGNGVVSCLSTFSLLCFPCPLAQVSRFFLLSGELKLLRHQITTQVCFALRFVWDLFWAQS